MKQLVLLVTLALSAASVHADVFKCKTGDAVTYSEKPCADNATVVSPGSPAPSAEAAKAAQDETVRDNTYVANSARERAARAARLYRAPVPPAVPNANIGTRHSTQVYAYGRRMEREEEEEEHERRGAPSGNTGAAAPGHAPGFSTPTPQRTTGIHARH